MKFTLKNYISILILIFLVINILTGCKNFLAGSDLKNLIDNEIEYANADSCKVIIKAETETGSFLVEGESELRIGFTQKIQFNIKQGYIFKKFIAVSSKDESVSRQNCVQFLSIIEDDDKGIYSAEVKLIKPADDILITADCFCIPEVVSTEPSSTSLTVPQDTSIVIKFNTFINSNFFINEDKLNKEHIQIMMGDKNLLESESESYFATPYFSQNNSVLTIPTNKKISIINEDSDLVKEISVNLDYEGIVPDTINKKFKIEYSFVYKINSSRDMLKPEILELKGFNIPDKNNIYYKEITDLPFNQWSKEKSERFLYGNYSQNNITDLYFHFRGYDKDSGIKYIKIQAFMTQDKNGFPVSDISEEPVYYYLDGQLNDNNEQELEFSYIFEKQTIGLYNVKVFIFDYADNYTEKNFEVFYSKPVDFSININGNTIPNIVFAYDEKGEKKEKIPAPEIKSVRASVETAGFYPECSSSLKFTLILKTENEEYELFSQVNNALLITNEIMSNLNEKLKDIFINPFVNNYFAFEVINTDTCYSKKQYVLIPKVVEASFFDKKTNTIFPEDIIDITGYNPVGFFTFESADDKNNNISDLVLCQSTIAYMKQYKRINFNGLGYQISNILNSNNGRGNGIYTFYLANSCSDFVSALGKPIKIYIGVDQPGGNNKLEAADFPNFKIKDQNIYEKNSSMVHLRVDFEEPDDEYTYLIKYKSTKFDTSSNGEETTYNYTKENELIVPNYGVCYISLVAIDSNNNIVGESNSNYFRNSKDVTPPVFYIYQGNSCGTIESPNDFIFMVEGGNIDRPLRPYDVNVANISKKTELAQVSYYFVPYTDYNYVNANRERLSEYTENFYVYSEHSDIKLNKYYELDTSALTNNIYSVFFKATDSYGNYVFNVSNLRNSNVVTFINNEKPDVSIYENNEHKEMFQIEIEKELEEYFNPEETENWRNSLDKSRKLTDEQINSLRVKFNFEYFNTETNSWKRFSIKDSENSNKLMPVYTNDTLFETKLENFFEYDDESELTIKSLDIKDKYIRITSRVEENVSSAEKIPETIFFQNVYLFPGYQIEEDNYPINNKNVTNGLLGYQISCDQPVFIHTMYNTRKLSDTCECNDISYWETKGKETGAMVKITNFTYMNENLEEVPDGAWYTTIIHFADGYTWMSEPQKK